MDPGGRARRRHGGARDEAFTELFRATQPKIRAYAHRRLPAVQADDVVSETFMVAWRRFDEVPTDHGEALLWLYRVAQYTVMNTYRSQRRVVALRSRLREGDPFSLAQSSVVIEGERDALAEAFASLSAEDRSVLLLATWEGLATDELAVALECASSAAATRLSRARSRFEAAVAHGETMAEGDG